MIGQAAGHQTVIMTLFGCKFGFRKCLELLGSVTELVFGLSYKTHFSSYHNPMEKWFIVLYNKKKGHSKMIFFKSVDSS